MNGNTSQASSSDELRQSEDRLLATIAKCNQQGMNIRPDVLGMLDAIGERMVIDLIEDTQRS